MAKIDSVLIKPLLTEKSQDATEKTNRYVFHVALGANKFQIKNAVEKMFDVKVLSVNTTTSAGKIKRAGKSFKKTPSKKKAYVQIEQGQKIELFKGI